MKERTLLFYLLFAIIVLLDVMFTNVDGWEKYRMFSKPSVIGSLMALVFANIPNIDLKTQRLLFLLLGLLLLGDIFFLTFDSEVFFLLGFLCFFSANIVYILLFHEHVDYQFGRVVVFSMFVLIYAFFLMRTIVDGLGGYFYPLVIFMVAAFNMMQASFFRWKQVNSRSYYMVFIGAVLFLLSESIVAVEKFADPIPFTDYLIMPTYAIGHLLMVKGILIE